MQIILNSTGASIDDICAIAANAQVSISDDAMGRVARAYACLARHTATGEAIYGVSTGLGAAVDTRLSPAAGAPQHRIPLARAVGVGRHADIEEVRAMTATRLARLCLGHAGASPSIVSALAAMLNNSIHPVVPMIGSVGEADLAPLAHIASVLTGAGLVGMPNGTSVSGAEAFAAAGIALPGFGLKDGLSLVSSNSASLGLACLAVRDARRLLQAHVTVLALSYEGFRASLNPILPAAVRLRPAPGQAAVSAELLRLLDGGELAAGAAARRLQDPISIRSAASVVGASVAAVQALMSSVELELGSSDDNPAILADEDRVQPNGNFEPTHLALSIDLLGLALARMAAMAAERMMKLLSPGFSDLPRFLAPAQPGSNGFATVQKTISALSAEIGHLALPMPFTAAPVADRVEDYASLAFSGVEKLRGIIERLQLLTAVEMMITAQAIELRGDLIVGAGCAVALRDIRSVCPPLDSDRPTGGDIQALASLVADGTFGRDGKLFAENDQ